MKLYIEPYKSLGPICLGMSLEQVRSELGLKYIFNEKKTICGIHVRANDYFPEIGFKVQYNDSNKCIFIELDDRHDVIYKEYDIFKNSCEKFISTFEKEDKNLLIDSPTIISEKFGFGIYAQNLEEDKSVLPELFSIFERGYYNG